jgi:hypothetical protein
MVGPQYTPQQRAFMVSTFTRTGSVAQTRALFAQQYPNINVPSKCTVKRNVVKYNNHGTSRNFNKERSGRP